MVQNTMTRTLERLYLQYNIVGIITDLKELQSLYKDSYVPSERIVLDNINNYTTAEIKTAADQADISYCFVIVLVNNIATALDKIEGNNSGYN